MTEEELRELESFLKDPGTDSAYVQVGTVLKLIASIDVDRARVKQLETLALNYQMTERTLRNAVKQLHEALKAQPPAFSADGDYSAAEKLKVTVLAETNALANP